MKRISLGDLGTKKFVVLIKCYINPVAPIRYLVHPLSHHPLPFLLIWIHDPVS